MPGDQRHDAADEDRDRRIENRDDEPRHEKSDDEVPRLAHIVPIKRREPGGRRRFRRDRRRLQKIFKKIEYAHG